MTSFEEQFPSLTGKKGIKEIIVELDLDCKGHKDRSEETSCELCGTNHTMTFEFFRELVSQYCLDKEKVREDIKKSSVSIGDFRDIDKRAIVKINNHTYDNRIEMLNNLKNKKIIFVDTLVKELKL